MAKPPTLHPYSDRGAFDRLMLLIAAIALHPGIGVRVLGISPMRMILDVMQELAEKQGIAWQDWSEATIREDLKALRKYGIMRSNTALRNGYYLGNDPPEVPEIVRQSREGKPRKDRKALLTPDEIVDLRDEGKSLTEVAALAGVSRERIRQIEKKARGQ